MPPLPPEFAPIASLHGLLALFVAVLAAYAALDMARRVQIARADIGPRWLFGAAVALGTGTASTHVILVGAQTLPFALGYDAWAMLGAWLMAMAVALLGLGWAGGRLVTRQRVLVGACGLALGIVASQVVAMQTMGLRPGVEWRWPALAAAAFAALLVTLPTLWVFFQVRLRSRRRAPAWQAIAAFGLGSAVVVSEVLVIVAAGLAEQRLSVFATQLPSGTLIGLASLGSVSLLVMMLVSSLLEAQMRRSLRRAKGELQKQSFTDPLTELPNRLMFEGALAQAVRDADTNEGRLALLAIGLDRFKSINQQFGHGSGDRLLREIAARLRARVRPNDVVARLGGDEFLLLLAGNPTRDEAMQLAARLIETIAQPCTLNGREATLTCSIGMAMYPEHGAMATLIAHADAALRTAKSTGGETACIFELRMLSGAPEHIDLLRDLRRALAQGELELCYQPKVHAPSGQITGAEALLRWHHPQRGSISPTLFIPIAERFGLIGAIGNWVIDEACRQARAWRDAGLRMRVSINISVHQLRRPDLAEHIAQALQRNRIEPARLTCEITESVAMEDPEGTMEMFKRLSAVGVSLSIDDFGTGYSSLSYLRKLPARELKIDRSFVLDIETSADARAVVDAVIKLAHALGLKVVAEGVETEGQYQLLRSFGCDELQGFLLARPMSAHDLLVWAMKVDEDDEPARSDFRESLFQRSALGDLGRL
jgi:diguanylate cyclase (GGDEF)-like protein